ncbi:MAG: GNAT family N-acetyltransferase [Pseudomonadaceae bacterium]|nr:GNAT family N-acetyltransferase [Pseudomonadaceae bacterium]
MKVVVVTRDDNLQKLAQDINAAAWDEGNEMSEYTSDALLAYFDRQDTLFVACYEEDAHHTLLGIASGRFEIKPYAHERWLYVDEVDVCANHRQKGVGKAIMQKLIKLAEEADCEEVWLGTEVDNQAANALYLSLEPDDVASVVGYTYEMEE